MILFHYPALSIDHMIINVDLKNARYFQFYPYNGYHVEGIVSCLSKNSARILFECEYQSYFLYANWNFEDFNIVSLSFLYSQELYFEYEASYLLILYNLQIFDYIVYRYLILSYTLLCTFSSLLWQYLFSYSEVFS